MKSRREMMTKLFKLKEQTANEEKADDDGGKL